MLVRFSTYSVKCDDCNDWLNLHPMADEQQALRDAKQRGAVELGTEILCAECMAKRDEHSALAPIPGLDR